IGLPAAFGVVVGVADIVAHFGALAADVTDVGHGTTLLKLLNYIKNLRESKGRKTVCGLRFAVFGGNLRIISTLVEPEAIRIFNEEQAPSRALNCSRRLQPA